MEEFIKMNMLSSMLQNIIHINDENHDVETWYIQMKAFKDMHKISEGEELYRYCAMTVQGKGLRSITDNIIRVSDTEISYPSLEQMKEHILKAYNMDVSPEDIIDQLKDMKISVDDNLKEFNLKYLDLYNKLSISEKLAITYKDYLNSIEYKHQAYKGVWLAGKMEISKAMEIAERHEDFVIKNKQKMEVKRKSNPNPNNQKNFNSQYKTKNFSTNPLETKPKIKVNACYCCGDSGHFKAECPEFIRQEYLRYKELVEKLDQNKKDSLNF